MTHTVEPMRTWWKRGFVAVAVVLLVFLVLRIRRDASDDRSVDPSPEASDGARQLAGATRHAHGVAALPRATLRGTVIDVAGKPVEGAAVVIISRPAGERPQDRRASTGADGRFEIASLQIGTYRVEATHEERVSPTATAEVRPAGGEVVLVLVPAATLVVEVRDDANNAPIPNATVRVALGNPDLGPVEAFVNARTNGAGEATFKNLSSIGAHHIVADADGYLHNDKNLIPLEHPRREQWRVRLLLHRGVATVNGRVIDRAGAPVPGAKIGWTKDQPDELLSQAIDWLPDPGLIGRKLTDEAGRFTIKVPPGVGCIDAIPRDHEIGHTCLTVKEGGTYTADVIVDDGAELAGTVVQDGNPVPGATVFLTEPGYAHQPWLEPVYRSRTQTDGNGRFHFRGIGAGALAAYAYTADASSDLVPVPLASDNQSTEIEIALEHTGVITGRVVDAQGEGVPAAVVGYFATANPGPPQLDAKGDIILPSEFSMARTIGGVVADPAGNFTITALPASLRFAIVANPPSASSVPTAYAAVEKRPVAPGEKITITLRGDGVVRGKVIYDDGSPVKRFGVSFGYHTTGGYSEGAFPAPHVVVSPDGRFSIPEVTAVAYAIEISAEDIVTRRLEGPIKVTGGQETDLGTIVVTRGRARTGRVRDQAGQPVPGAQVLFGSGQPERFTTVNADERGEFTIPATTAGTKIRLRAEADDLVSDWLPLSPTGNVVLVVGLTAKGVVSGMVIDRFPVDRRAAVVTPVGTGEPLNDLPVLATADVDNTGRFHLAVPPGQYQCWVRRDVGDPAGTWWSQTIQVAPGKETHVVATLESATGGK